MHSRRRITICSCVALRELVYLFPGCAAELEGMYSATHESLSRCVVHSSSRKKKLAPCDVILIEASLPSIPMRHQERREMCSVVLIFHNYS